MSASGSLSSQFKYLLHGSPIRIPVGEPVLPALKVSTPEHIKARDMANTGYKPNRIYMTPHPITALQYAWTPEDSANESTVPSGFIHVVEPSGRLLRDTSSRHAIISDSRHASGARVVGNFPARLLVSKEGVTDEDIQTYNDYMSQFK
jgi:hypothetical protein